MELSEGHWAVESSKKVKAAVSKGNLMRHKGILSKDTTNVFVFSERKRAKLFLGEITNYFSVFCSK